MAKRIAMKNGIVMDGTGNKSFQADVIIEDDRIVDIGMFPDAHADMVMDCDGLTVAPGFIDVHSHLDFLFPSPRHADVLKSWIHQGVTTIVSGNCGFSAAPINHEVTSDLNTYWHFAIPREGLDYNWNTMGEYLGYLEQKGLAYNVAVLTGHNTLRLNAIGSDARFASSDEIRVMKEQLHQSLKSGSIGFSVGLNYWPGTYSESDEVVQLASVPREFGKPLVCHPRGESYTYDSAIDEMILAAEINKIPLHISHHMGGLVPDFAVRIKTDEKIRQAVERGIEIGYDNYPWSTGGTTMMSFLPPKLMDRGAAVFFQRLQDPVVRKQVINELKNHVPKWPTWENNYWTDKWYDPQIRVSGFQIEKNREFEFMTLQEIADKLKKDIYETGLDLLVEEEGRLFCYMGLFDHPQDDDVIKFLLSDPKCSIGSDVVGMDYNPHTPVAYGTFTKVLGSLARDKGFMSQEEAVRRMTSLPASQMQLKDRGIVRKGAYADVTVFNSKTVNNRATFENPFVMSEGIVHVIINGNVVLDHGSYMIESRPGRILKS